VLREGDEGEERGLLFEGRGGESEEMDVDLSEARGPV
jgi:chloride channel 3/4/5